MRTRLTIALLLACLPLASEANDGDIVIQTASGATSACLETLVPMELQVFARLQGQSADGIRGAEYRIVTSVATDWLFLENTFDRGGVVVGITIDDDGGSWLAPQNKGVNIAFNRCQVEPTGFLLLQEIQVFDLTGAFAGTPMTLSVEGKDQPGNPFYRCPLFNICDGPVFTKACLGNDEHLVVCPFPPGALACRVSTSRQFYINHDPNDPASCTVAVEGRTWSQMKSLYH